MVLPIEIQETTIGFVDSRIGGRKENQDAAGIKDTALGLLVVVCDGMGGMQGGSVASELAVRTILETVAAADKQDNPSMVLIKAIQSANTAIIEEGNMHPDLTGMGTTVTALLLSPYSAITAHIGDSRIYQLRNGKKVYRTFDHSMVFEMVRKNVISEEQARLSAQSNVILKALGVMPDVEVEVKELPYLKGDRFVLCTDGFWGAMPESDFIRHLSVRNTIDKILESTANQVEGIGRQKGGDYDNLTAAILDMNKNSILKEKMNRYAKILIVVLSILLMGSVALNIGFILGKVKMPFEEVNTEQQTEETKLDDQTKSLAEPQEEHSEIPTTTSKTIEEGQE